MSFTIQVDKIEYGITTTKAIYTIESALFSINSFSIGDFKDVTLTNPATGELLVYNSVTDLWTNSAGGTGVGDMTKAVYDPTTVEGDAFDMDNMVEGTNLILSASERSAISTNSSKISYTDSAAVSLNTDKISYTDSSAVSLNTAKTGITPTQTSDITTNNGKVSYSTAASDAVALNTAKVGITPTQASNISTNNGKISYTDSVAVGLNTAKISYTDASAVSTNSAKISFDSTSSTKLGTIAEGAEVNVQSDWDSTSGDNLILNKPTTITGTQTSNITTNNAKVSYTDSAAVSANTSKETNATHSGDATGATALTLATVNSNVGTFTAADITVNAKGLITAAANGSGGGGGNVSTSGSPVDDDFAKFVNGTDIEGRSYSEVKIDLSLNNVPNTDFTTPVSDNTTHRGVTTGNPHSVTKTNVGLSAVPNTNFTTPVGDNTTHRGLTNNPHGVDASDVSLGNVDNVATDDTAYNTTSWNTNTDAATKNAIRDKIETMDTAIGLNTSKNTNATHTGDATGATALTVVKINGTLMSGLATGILKNTTGTGVPSIAVAGDFPTLNQSTTGNAATATLADDATTLKTPRTIAGVSFDGSANISLNNNAITNGAGYTTATGAVTSVSGGTAITSTGGNTPSLSVTADSIGDTQLTYNTGQHLTTTSTPAFAEATIPILNGNSTVNGDFSIVSTNPKFNFDETDSYKWQLFASSGNFYFKNEDAVAGTFRIRGNDNADVFLVDIATQEATFAGDIIVGGTVDGVDIATDVTANNSYRAVGHLPLAGGTLTNTLTINQNSDVNTLDISANSDNDGIVFNQTGILSNGNYCLNIYSGAAQTSALGSFAQNNALSTGDVLLLTSSGSGSCLVANGNEIIDSDGNLVGGSGGSAQVVERTQEGEVYTATLMYYRAPSAVTLTSFVATLGARPEGQNFTIEMQKNGTTITGTTLSITTAASVSNGVYSSASGTLAISVSAGDVLTVVVTQVGSTFSGTDLSAIYVMG